jgi:hypothetical protein
MERILREASPLEEAEEAKKKKDDPDIIISKERHYKVRAVKIYEDENIGLILHTFGRGFFVSYGFAKQEGTASIFVNLLNERTFFSSSSVVRFIWDT